MKRIDDPSWRYVPAAKSHVGFKQRLRRYAEMVRNENVGNPDGATMDSDVVASGPVCLRNQFGDE